MPTASTARRPRPHQQQRTLTPFSGQMMVQALLNAKRFNATSTIQ